MRRGGRVIPRSVRRRGLDRELAESRATVIDRSYGRCEANTPACPPGDHWGEHAHHVKPRSAGGDHLPENLLWVCGAGGAHDWIHAHPEVAHEAGWLKKSWE